MVNAFIVRHGATPWNEAGRLQGWSDVPLTSEGRREAERAGEAIDTIGEPDRIITSPLRRAVDTAEIISARTGIRDVETASGWKERSFGSLEGKRANTAFSEHPELHPKSQTFSPAAALDGESCRTVIDRVRSCWSSVVRADEPVIVVTHETPMRIVTGLVDDTDPIEALQRRSFTPGSTVGIRGQNRGTGSVWWKISVG